MHVLLIEDNEDDEELIRDALCRHSPHDIVLDWADRLEVGLMKLAERPVDAVLVDLSLPDSQGLETLDRVRDQARESAVIVLTGLDNETVAEKSLLHGAQDYLVKGRLTGDALRRAIRYAMGRHRVEQALRKSEERFHLTCLATQDGIWDWDIASDTTWFNDAYQTVYGLGSQELQKGRIPWADQIHPEDRAAVIAGLTQGLQSEQHLWTAEYRFRRNDGTYAYVIDHGYVLRDHQGTPYRMIGAKTDITERRQAETMHAVQLAVGLALEESVTLSEAVPKILRAMCELQGWTLGALWLIDPSQKSLHCNALWHQSGESIEAFAQSYRALSLQQSVGLSGQAWSTDAAVLCPDISKEPKFPAREAAQQVDLHGAIAFPIHAGKEIIGIMEFLTYEVLRPAAFRLERITELGAMISQFLNRKDLERQKRQMNLELQKAKQEAELAKLRAQIDQLKGGQPQGGMGVPPGPTGLQTFEVFGIVGGRLAPMTAAITNSGGRWSVNPGASVMVTQAPNEGYGLGGMPGRWSMYYAGRNPAEFGLDPDKAVMASDGSRGWALPSSLLTQIFGSNWRQVVYS